jgi:2-hydroxychromene-2-carboxylate isomerase
MAPTSSSSAPTLEFWFDFSSPYAYLASTQVRRVADAHGAELVYQPFLLGALFKAIGTPLVPVMEASEARRRYQGRDLHDWAEHYGVPFRFPSRFPLRTLKPLRMVLAAPAEQRGPLVDQIMARCWAEDADPEDDAGLAGAARAAGADANALLEGAQDPEVKERLKRQTEAAAERGFPGAPTFVVGDRFWWGQDRLVLVERALERARG